MTVVDICIWICQVTSFFLFILNACYCKSTKLMFFELIILQIRLMLPLVEGRHTLPANDFPIIGVLIRFVFFWLCFVLCCMTTKSKQLCMFIINVVLIMTGHWYFYRQYPIKIFIGICCLMFISTLLICNIVLMFMNQRKLLMEFQHKMQKI